MRCAYIGFRKQCPNPATTGNFCPVHMVLPAEPTEVSALTATAPDASTGGSAVRPELRTPLRPTALECAPDAENSVAEQAPPASSCSATTRAGRPCRFYTPPGATHCINHRIGADTSAAASHAARASAKARRVPTGQFLETVLSFNDRPSIQAVLDTVTRMVLAHRLDPASAAVVLRACSIATRNFDRAPETLQGYMPQEHEWWNYVRKVEALLHSVDRLLEVPSDEPDESA